MEPEWYRWEIEYFEDDTWKLWKRDFYTRTYVNPTTFEPRFENTDPREELAKHKARNVNGKYAETFNKLKWRIRSYRQEPVMCTCRIETKIEEV